MSSPPDHNPQVRIDPLTQARDRFSLMLSTLQDREDMGIKDMSVAQMSCKESEQVLHFLSEVGLDLAQDATYHPLGITGLDDYYMIECAPHFRQLQKKLTLLQELVTSDEKLTTNFSEVSDPDDLYYKLLVSLAPHFCPDSHLAIRAVPLPDKTAQTCVLLKELQYDAQDMTLRTKKGFISREEILSWAEEASEFIQQITYQPTDTLRQTYRDPAYGFLSLEAQ